MKFLRKLLGRGDAEAPLSGSFELDKVFNSTAVPPLTFIDRSPDQPSIRQIRNALLMSGQIVCIHGPSKSGKTTFVRRLANEEGADCVLIKGTDVNDLNSFWIAVGEALKVKVEQTTLTSEKDALTQSKGARVGASLSSGLAALKAQASIEETKSLEATSVVHHASLQSVKTAVLEALEKHQSWILVDDFHMACTSAQENASPEDSQRKRHRIFDDLKGIVGDEGVHFIFTSIPREPIDPVGGGGQKVVDAQLGQRVSVFEFPAWNTAELSQIPELGFKLLGLEGQPGIFERIGKAALGSPLNVHKICATICLNLGARRTVPPDERPRSVTLETVRAAIGDFIRSQEIYAGYVEDLLSVDLASGSARVNFRNREISLNELILMALAKSHIHQEFGLKISNLRNRMKHVARAHRWSSDAIVRRLKVMSDITITLTLSSNAEFARKHQPIIFDNAANKVFLVDPGLAMYLDEMFKADLAWLR